jgi:hypothetical protein
MAHHVGNAAVTYVASGVAMGSAVVAQSVQENSPPLATGAVALGAASIIAAAGPHLMALAHRWFDDRQHARSTNVVTLVNKVAELERLAFAAEALKDKAAVMAARYEESQSELEELRQIITGLIPPIVENQEDLRKIATGWKHPGPPKLKAGDDPAPIPQPPSRGSGSGLHPVFPPDPDPESAIGGTKP